MCFCIRDLYRQHRVRQHLGAMCTATSIGPQRHLRVCDSESDCTPCGQVSFDAGTIKQLSRSWSLEISCFITLVTPDCAHGATFRACIFMV